MAFHTGIDQTRVHTNEGVTMSQYFDMGSETLWNPSNGVSILFQRQVAAFEDELQLSSGIGPMENDESQLDSAIFEIFVNALLAKRKRANQTVLIALSEGFTATMLVLAERAGIRVNSDPVAPPGDSLTDTQDSPMTEINAFAVPQSWGTGMRDKVKELERQMPR